MRIGFAGLGRMGVPMARNIAAAGFDLTLWTRSTDKAQALATDLGCDVAESPRALSDASDVVVTMLGDDLASQEVHTGLFAGATRTYVEMGTMSPDYIHWLGAQAPKGSTVIDAQVSGTNTGRDRCAAGIMVGYDKATAAPLRPLLAALGRQTVCPGRLGAGAVMKLVVNSLIHGISHTLAEAQGYGPRDMAVILPFMRKETPRKQLCLSVVGKATRRWISPIGTAICCGPKGSR